jgi:hypothetical protein
MLWMLIAMLLVLWLLGYTLANIGSLIYILLVIALIVLSYQLVAGRTIPQAKTREYLTAETPNLGDLHPPPVDSNGWKSSLRSMALHQDRQCVSHRLNQTGNNDRFIHSD